MVTVGRGDDKPFVPYGKLSQVALFAARLDNVLPNVAALLGLSLFAFGPEGAAGGAAAGV